jgi:hypothetical protein
MFLAIEGMSSGLCDLFLVREAHAAGGLCAQVNTDAQEVRRTGGFAALTAHAIFRTGRSRNRSGPVPIPGNHFQDIQRASTDTLGASNTGIVDLYAMRHRNPFESCRLGYGLQCIVPRKAEQQFGYIS